MKYFVEQDLNYNPDNKVLKETQFKIKTNLIQSSGLALCKNETNLLQDKLSTINIHIFEDVGDGAEIMMIFTIDLEHI